MLGRATIKDVEGGVGSTEGHRGARTRRLYEIYEIGHKFKRRGVYARSRNVKFLDLKI